MIKIHKIFFWVQAVEIIAASLARSGKTGSHSLVRYANVKLFWPAFFCSFFLLIFSDINAQQLIIKFHHTANNQPLVLSDSSYTNSSGESYQLTRLKYYISNVSLHPAIEKNVSLIDAASTDSIIIHPKPGTYSKLYFKLGVDSAFNCSGAQDGALDPLNGMFWTWNSGYIFFKMEGYSPASTADLNRIEHHVGGYRSPYKVSQEIELQLPDKLVLSKNDNITINVALNLDKYWDGINRIKISDQALLMTPGQLAVKAAGNFKQMFSIINIKN